MGEGIVTRKEMAKPVDWFEQIAKVEEEDRNLELYSIDTGELKVSFKTDKDLNVKAEVSRKATMSTVKAGPGCGCGNCERVEYNVTDLGYEYVPETQDFVDIESGDTRTFDDVMDTAVEKYLSRDKKASVRKKADYEGWSNYETWALALWVDNDQGLHEMVIEEGVRLLGTEAGEDDIKYKLGAWLKDQVGEMNPLSGEASMFSDLLSGAISEIDFREAAEHFITTAKENAAYDEAKQQKEQPAEEGE